jgi:hypothetical protein
VSIVTTVVVLSVRHAKRPKEYLNTEDIIKKLKILSFMTEEIVEHRDQKTLAQSIKYKACPDESGTEVGAPLFPAVELCDISGRWQCMSREIWYTLDSGSVLLTETEAR